MAFTRPVSIFLYFFGGRAGGVRLGAPMGDTNFSLRPLRFAAQAPPDGIQNIIWAFSRTAPESTDANVDIKIHHEFGGATLNLTRTAAAPSGDDTDEGGADGANGTESIVPWLAGFVHAGLCMAAFMLVIPSGALVVRYAKLTGSSAAFDLHRNLQLGVGAFVFGP